MKYISEPEQPKQDDWKFVKELSSPVCRHFNWTRNLVKNREADLSCGVKIQNDFTKNNGNLDTAFQDLDSFFAAAQINLNGKYKIIFEKIETVCFESFRLDIMPDSCRIQANDSEGIRRGIYYLEDLLLGADGPFLPLGVISRKPWLESRISRCFYGPIKRPPLNRDELLDNVDYYPDEYLNRLAHEGVNGLWLTVVFSDLCKTSITKLPPDAEQRLTKLRKTVEKCLRYGIKTYIFCIEPRAMAENDLILLHNPELKGPEARGGNYCFCPFSDVAQQYLYESINWIFSKVPNLGGMINISYGERPTTCASVDFGKSCSNCLQKTPGEIIAASLKPMERGMHDANPAAKLISWLYVPENYTGYKEDETLQLLDIAEKLPKNVILQYNFESGGSKEQLGKQRHAGDYWLSYVGPSEKYKNIMNTAQNNGKQISAKIQVSCSHEVATVPLVPVPGLLHQKYKAMHDLGVTHVMQCWYFGNYPGIMNKAAGELAFEDFTSSEKDFLLRLALPQWGKNAEQTVRAWELLADGYANYPLENMFQYYGPMHDGVVWPLYLKPVDKPLAPTWKVEYGTSGDRYGECLGTFSLEEVLSLCKELSDTWHDGVKNLQDIPVISNDQQKSIALAEALNIQFQSSYNIMKFYSLRNKLLKTSGNNGLKILRKMQGLVIAEIENSTHMIKLCEADPRLGFHPEAESYKYFPEKLIWRIELLKSLLEEDFPYVQKRLFADERAFTEGEFKTYYCNSNQFEYTEDFAWKADYSNGKLKIIIDNFDKSVGDAFKITLEKKAFYPPYIITVVSDEIIIPLAPDTKEVGFNIFKINKIESNKTYSSWQTFSPLPSRLVLGNYNPQAKGKLILSA